jgi:hypothetical protein
MKFFRANAPLIIGLSIPILLIVGIATIIYIPGLFIHPKTNFLYVLNNGNYGNNCDQYEVSAGALQRVAANPPFPESKAPCAPEAQLYVYDVAQQRSSAISFTDAQALRLDAGSQSPDGFSIEQGGRGGDFLFMFGGYSDYNSHYLVGDGVSQKINVTESGNYYSNQFRFLGWILQ